MTFRIEADEVESQEVESQEVESLNTAPEQITDSGPKITISPIRTAVVMMAITSVIVATSVAMNLLGLDINRLDVDEEQSVGTLWTGIQLAFLVLLLGASAVVARRRGERWKPWLIVAACAAYVMADDVITIHEATTEPLREALDTDGFLTFAWIIPYSIVALVIAVVLFPWVRTLNQTTRKGMFIAAGLFLAGAVVMEGVGGTLIDAAGQASVTDGEGFTSTGYMLSTSFEEFLEMISVAIAVGAVMFDLSRRGPFSVAIEAPESR